MQWVKLYRPAILVLLETKMSEYKSLISALGYDAQVQSSMVGLTGGIVFMWKEDHLYPDNFTVITQGIHAIVKVIYEPSLPWFFSAIYVSPNLNSRRLL